MTTLKTTDSLGRERTQTPEGWRLFSVAGGFAAEPTDYKGDVQYSPTFATRAEAAAWARHEAEVAQAEADAREQAWIDAANAYDDGRV